MPLRRSPLSTPASNMEMMRKAAASAADEVVLDLEDAVAEDSKDEARQGLIRAVTEIEWGDTLVSVRINALDTPHAYGDLVTVVEAVGTDIDSIVVPKITRSEDVYAVDTWLGSIEQSEELSDRIPLQLLIEDTTAIQHIDDIAAMSERVEALVFGSGDYAASIGLEHPSARPAQNDPVGDVWYHVRNEIATAASSNGLQVIDGPYVDFGNTDGFTLEAQRAEALGFDGKWLIHPSQIPIANDVFSPSPEAIEHAQAIVDGLDEGGAAGSGAVNLDDVMIDAAHYDQAVETIDRARQIGLLDE